MTKYESAAELAQKVDIQTYYDVAMAGHKVRAQIIIYVDEFIPNEALAQAAIGPEELIKIVVKDLVQRVVRRLVTKELYDELQTLRAIANEAYKCPYPENHSSIRGLYDKRD